MQQDSYKICNLCSKEADICLMNFGVNHATSSEATQIDFFGILVNNIFLIFFCPFHFFIFSQKVEAINCKKMEGITIKKWIIEKNYNLQNNHFYRELLHYHIQISIKYLYSYDSVKLGENTPYEIYQYFMINSKRHFPKKKNIYI